MSERILADRYRLQHHLARGGMADVYAAQDELLGRPVAVKMLHASYATNEAFVQRFKREAQAAANLSHPNIVGIYDTGVDEGTYFIVMELIDGPTLRDVLREEGMIHPRRATEIAAEVAAALAVAHRGGLVHRDVKPGNIMLTQDGTVKVTDFGIARAWDDSEELTRTGAVIGTATYFSPEQAQGLPADGRSDIYSLGVVLYEMVTGRPPFSGESPVSVAYQHVSELPQSAMSLNPDVSPLLDTVIMRALQKAPANRYQTAEDFRADLVAYLQGAIPTGTTAVVSADAATRVVAATPPPPTVPPDEVYRQVAGSERRGTEWTFVLGVVALLLILAGGVFALSRLLGGEDTTPPAAAEVTVPNLVGETRDRAVAVLQELGLRLSISEQPSDDVPAGTVAGTEPPAGTVLQEGDPVLLVISTGPETFSVPAVEGRLVDVARQRVMEQGFVVEIVEESDTETLAGVVIRQDPAAGTLHPPGTVVTLTVSTGPESFILPEFAGFTEVEASVALAGQGVEVAREPVFDSTIEDGLVIRTDPPAGTEVKAGETVTLVVSQGPEPVQVPAVVGNTRQEARNAIEGVGLVFVLGEPVEVVADSGLEGTVISQQPAAGILVEPGTQVIVRIGQAPATTTTSSTTTTTTAPDTTTTTAPATTTTSPATTTTAPP